MNKLLTIIISLNIVSSINLQSSDQCDAGYNYILQNEISFLKAHNAKLRKDLGYVAKRIPTYLERISKQTKLDPSANEIHAALKEEQNELFDTKPPFSFENLRISSNFLYDTKYKICFLASLACTIGILTLDVALNWISEALAKSRAETVLLETREEFEQQSDTVFNKQ